MPHLPQRGQGAKATLLHGFSPKSRPAEMGTEPGESALVSQKRSPGTFDAQNLFVA
jgi:hypothetical protein